MNMIPNYLDPYPDELLYSWIHRLAKANGLPVPDFVRTYLPGEQVRDYINPDTRSGIPALYERIPHDDFPDVKDFVLNFSTLPFASLSMPDFVVAQYVNNIFQPYNSLNYPARGLFNKPCVCPECMKEDAARYGEPYMHKKHQLPGVCTCKEHGTWLYRYNRYSPNGNLIKHRYECDYDLDDYIEITEHPSPSDAAAYAGYACAVLDAGIVTDFSHVWRIISQCVADRASAYETRFDEFFDDYERWEHAGLHSFNDRKALVVHATTVFGLHMEEVMPMAMFLFPDPAEFTAKIAGRGSVLNEYACPVCDHEYCTATGNAWICPRCNRDASGEETFALLVDTLGDGEYEVLSPFKSLHKPVSMRHKPCGRITNYYPMRFLYRGMRCSCEKSSESLRFISSRETWDARWLERFELYKEYVKETGCSHIPISEEYRGVKLGTWAARQRTADNNNRLPADRKAALLKFEPDFFSPEVLKKRDKEKHS